jgi:hypothetical protein
MRLLTFDAQGDLILTKDEPTAPAAYAILSHTWGADDDEVTFDDIEKKTGRNKAGYAKLWFCANQAKHDGLDYCWVDTCCINKANLVELSEAITSMFRWYQGADRCYVYLADVTVGHQSQPIMRHAWEDAFRASRWFTRGWTLQELLAPAVVSFFSVEGQLLGNKQTLEGLIHSITNLPVAALRGTSLMTFSVDERLRWTQGRRTKKAEDRAYCLLGIFGVYMPLIYGEGENAFVRLEAEIKKRAGTTAAVMPEMKITDVPRFYTIVCAHPLDRHADPESALHGTGRHAARAGVCHQPRPGPSSPSRPMPDCGVGDGRARQERDLPAARPSLSTEVLGCVLD